MRVWGSGAPPAVGLNTCKPGGMNTQTPQTAVSITDKFAATAELAELLSRRDVDSRIVALLCEHAGTAVGRALLDLMVDEWAKENHLVS